MARHVDIVDTAVAVPGVEGDAGQGVEGSAARLRQPEGKVHVDVDEQGVAVVVAEGAADGRRYAQVLRECIPE